MGREEREVKRREEGGSEDSIVDHAVCMYRWYILYIQPPPIVLTHTHTHIPGDSL